MRGCFDLSGGRVSSHKGGRKQIRALEKELERTRMEAREKIAKLRKELEEAKKKSESRGRSTRKQMVIRDSPFPSPEPTR